LDVRQPETRQCSLSVVEWVVVVPLVSVGVLKDHDRWEVVVVVDYVTCGGLASTLQAMALNRYLR
jgi:hypothetical protein